MELKPIMTNYPFPLSPDEFKDKRVLITGGTKGAGKAIAERFLMGGATVVITARSAPAEKTPSHFIQADVSTSEGTASAPVFSQDLADHRTLLASSSRANDISKMSGRIFRLQCLRSAGHSGSERLRVGDGMTKLPQWAERLRGR
jgi:NAD(P)-dependent dehydrogenase (short-subunit alcohol dehydrogenase family)